MTFSNMILHIEPQLRLFTFIGILLIMALWEMLRPCRKLLAAKPRRWLHNINLTVLNTLVIRFSFPILAVGWAQTMETIQWGLFNTVTLPLWVSIILSILLLDMVIYFQHRVFHQWPLLWRLHQVHHADLDIDVSTALRFHPLEIIISMIIKLGAITLLGAHPVAVILFEIFLNGMAMFNHGNVLIPKRLDSFLRIFVVTPDVHRVHHSVILKESNQNFGFSLVWWDRLFGTYQDQPNEGHQKMKIGLDYLRHEKRLTFWYLLILPFSKPY